MSEKTTALSPVLAFIPYKFIPAISGGEKGKIGYLSHLAAERKVIVFSSDDNLETHPYGFELVRGFKPSKLKYFNLFLAWQIVQLCKKYNIRSILVEQPFAIIPAYLAAKLARLPFVIYSHNIEYNRFRSMGKWWWAGLYVLERVAYALADHIQFAAYDDMEFVINKLKKDKSKCSFATFGTYQQSIPTHKEVQQAKDWVREKHHFLPTQKLILFHGMLGYQPNTEAVEEIIYKIAPHLKQTATFDYQIMVIGGGLPAKYEKLAAYQSLNVAYIGFVDEVEPYIKAADLMINPIYSGGGVKTKVIEALSYNKNVVSYESGALGLYKEVCKQKLFITNDKDSDEFVKQITVATNSQIDNTEAFYEVYFWGNVAKKYPFK
jgi:hypothetical protein